MQTPTVVFISRMGQENASLASCKIQPRNTPKNIKVSYFLFIKRHIVHHKGFNNGNKKKILKYHYQMLPKTINILSPK